MGKIKTIFICMQFLCVFLFAFSAGAQEKAKEQKTAKITVEVVENPADLEALMKRNAERLRHRHGKGHKPGDKADEKKEKGTGKDAKDLEKKKYEGMNKKGHDEKKKLQGGKKAGAKEKYKKYDRREKRRMKKKYMEKKDGETRKGEQKP